MSEQGRDSIEPQLSHQREVIDEIDKELVRLINERAAAAIAVAAIKRQHDLPVFVPAREEIVIQKVTALNNGPLSDLQIADLFRFIMDQSKVLQHKRIQAIPTNEQVDEP